MFAKIVKVVPIQAGLLLERDDPCSCATCSRADDEPHEYVPIGPGPIAFEVHPLRPSVPDLARWRVLTLCPAAAGPRASLRRAGMVRGRAPYRLPIPPSPSRRTRFP